MPLFNGAIDEVFVRVIRSVRVTEFIDFADRCFDRVDWPLLCFAELHCSFSLRIILFITKQFSCIFVFVFVSHRYFGKFVDK